MCGICGVVGLNGEEVSVSAVEKMTGAMKKRGPDAQGLVAQNNRVLGHRRLKIIDLSENAQQPMVDSALGLSIVFNGAVYNYQNLRSELEKKGYRFFSSGDTEVILKAYHAWGKECVKRFNGMFAFVIQHRDDGRLFAARDRLGIKPFYYVKTPKEFRFASTLPAVIAGGDVDTDIDPVALNYYMTFHSVVPAPHTILSGVKKLPPASTLKIDAEGQMEMGTYWDLRFIPDENEQELGFDEWKKRVLGSLRDAVRRRLVADVPVGVLLSGGLDSSLVVGLLAELGQKDIRTFSIGFEDVGGEKGNEFAYSDLIAKKFGTTHHKIKADAAHVLPTLTKCIQAMSEPMVSHDCIGFYLLSEAVAQHVKVVQSGQGADEIFGGYHWYPKLMGIQDSLMGYAGAFFDRSFPEYAAAVDPRFVTTDHSLGFVREHFALPGVRSTVDKALRIDTTVMLVDDPVKRVDNMTMAWGLEARVPFLDHELVELAARVPADYKIASGGKHVLKECARPVVPDEVIDRPKGYFPVPALKFLQGEYLDWVKDVFNSPESRQRRLFNPEYVADVMADPGKHITQLDGSKLWQMTVLEHWLNVHGL